MSGRRSGRIKKAFNYSSFLGEDNSSDESDDDFVGSSAPPLKKAKSSQEENLKKNCLLTPEKQKNNKTKTKRKKLDDKLFERDMKMAMELSMNGDTLLSEKMPEKNKNSQEKKSEVEEKLPHKELLYLSRHDIHSPPKSPPVLTLSVSEEKEDADNNGTLSNNKQQPIMPVLTPILNGPSDDIELIDEEEEKKPIRNRRTSGRTIKKILIESEDSEDDDDDDSEFEERGSSSDENSDFEIKTKNKKKKEILPKKSKKENVKNSGSQSSTKKKTEVKKSTNLNKMQQKSSPIKPSRSHLISSPKPNSRVSLPPLSTKTSSITKCQNLSPLGNQNSKIKPNSTNSTINLIVRNPLGKSVGSLSNVTSPPTSIRRLGLSRNQKVKPLHPTLKVNY